uniref:Uncharacterized protein n=1 Tax=Geobacter sp. (strain M21) TaxID=443144 RepID=C6E3Q1_GEOSM
MPDLRSLGMVGTDTASTPRTLSQLYEHHARREGIAEKVLAGKRLNINEKEEIYRLLTGRKPKDSTKKGRPSTVDRDFMLAVDYLHLRDGKRTDLLRLHLAEKHGLLKNDKKYRENTFYLAVNRGIQELQRFATHWLEQFYSGNFEFFGKVDTDKIKHHAERMEMALRRIENYRKPTSPKKLAK